VMVMPANHSSPAVHYWAGRYPGKIGWLIGPTAMPKTKLRKWMPFALDNDAFSVWTNKTEWNESAWQAMLNKVSRFNADPLWALVPDVVADRDGTLKKWELFSPVITAFGWPRAFAVQDGMTPKDVPRNADVVFVGGTTAWKWRTVKIWTSNFLRVHVGRVNSVERLQLCEEIGVESVDGTGWFRDSEHAGKARLLEAWIEGAIQRQLSLFSA
jgi:hypothetical protein